MVFVIYIKIYLFIYIQYITRIDFGIDFVFVFIKEFFREYHKYHPRQEPYFEQRQGTIYEYLLFMIYLFHLIIRMKISELYQLYHYLNHYYLFGGGYQRSAISIMRRLCDLV